MHCILAKTSTMTTFPQTETYRFYNNLRPDLHNSLTDGWRERSICLSKDKHSLIPKEWKQCILRFKHKLLGLIQCILKCLLKSSRFRGNVFWGNPGFDTSELWMSALREEEVADLTVTVQELTFNYLKKNI